MKLNIIVFFSFFAVTKWKIPGTTTVYNNSPNHISFQVCKFQKNCFKFTICIAEQRVKITASRCVYELEKCTKMLSGRAPCWESLQRCSRHHSWIKGSLLLSGERGSGKVRKGRWKGTVQDGKRDGDMAVFRGFTESNPRNCGLNFLAQIQHTKKKHWHHVSWSQNIPKIRLRPGLRPAPRCEAHSAPQTP